MTFDEYLSAKKIDSGVFRQCEPQRWQEYENVFGQVHPDSFTVQKKFVINDLRRLYQLKPSETTPASATPEKKAARPMMRPAVATAVAVETMPLETVSGESAKPGQPEPQPKKAAKPLMRPVVKSADQTGAEQKTVSFGNAKPPAETPVEMPASETPAVKKPARPVMRSAQEP